MKQLPQTTKCKTSEMMVYSVGECANSLVMNSLFGYAMLYYTKALGLTPGLAGWALFVAILWDAASDPIMGHISDNTRSRFGKRHPYLLLGGLAMVVSFFFLWYVPDFFKSSNTTLFWYLVVMNLILRTTFTAFIIPYTALGFEICTDYFGRTKLQGIKMTMYMAAKKGEILKPEKSTAVQIGGSAPTIVQPIINQDGQVAHVHCQVVCNTCTTTAARAGWPMSTTRQPAQRKASVVGKRLRR